MCVAMLGRLPGMLLIGFGDPVSLLRETTWTLALVPFLREGRRCCVRYLFLHLRDSLRL